MNTATKYHLVERLVNTENDVVLEQIKAILDSPETDFWESLPPKSQKGILQGKEDVRNGKTFSHESTMNDIRRKITK